MNTVIVYFSAIKDSIWWLLLICYVQAFELHFIQSAACFPTSYLHGVTTQMTMTYIMNKFCNCQFYKWRSQLLCCNSQLIVNYIFQLVETSSVHNFAVALP